MTCLWAAIGRGPRNPLTLRGDPVRYVARATSRHPKSPPA